MSDLEGDGNLRNNQDDEQDSSGLDQIIEQYIATKFSSQPCRYPDNSIHQIKKYISTYLDVILAKSYALTTQANPTAVDPEIAAGFVEEAARTCNEPRIIPPYDGLIMWGKNIGNALIGALISQLITIFLSTTPVTRSETIIVGVLVVTTLIAFLAPKFMHHQSLKIVAPR